MIYFPHVEFVQAVALANKATRRGDVKAAARWLRLAEQHMKLFSLYNAGEAEDQRVSDKHLEDYYRAQETLRPRRG